MATAATSYHPKNNKTASLIITIVETVFLAIAGIGAILKFSGQGGSIMLIAGLSALAFYYMASGALAELIGPKDLNNSSKIVRNAIGITFAVLLMGILFRLQMWPNLTGALAVPLLIATIGIIIFSFIKPNIIDRRVGKWALPRTMLIAVPIIFFATHSHSEYYALQGPYRNDPKFMELFAACRDHRERCDEYRAYHDSLWVLKHGESRNTNR